MLARTLSFVMNVWQSSASVCDLLASTKLWSLTLPSDSGAQPLVSEDGKLILAVNGEIYNHQAIRTAYDSEAKFKTRSDCEVILPLVCSLFRASLHSKTDRATRCQYKKHDKDLCNQLDGIFSFVLLDESVTPTRIIAARDPIGVTTLYQGWNSKRPGATYFASELKSIVDECDKIISFPPGHVYDSRDNSTTQYFQPSWWSGDQDNGRIASSPADLTLLRETLEASVRKRLMAEVPYGVLLSGGLDSSLIASIATREAKKLAQAQLTRQNGLTVNGASSDRGQFFVPLILT